MSPTHSGEPELKKRKTSGPASANSGRPAGENSIIIKKQTCLTRKVVAMDF
jgi:hypothetical protein